METYTSTADPPPKRSGYNLIVIMGLDLGTKWLSRLLLCQVLTNPEWESSNYYDSVV